MLRLQGTRTPWNHPATRLIGEYLALFGLLFVARFVARGHLAPRMDQECHIGGIAVDVLAHGIRFPLAAYSPNEYDNGSFISGVLTAMSFAVLGQRVLSLKLVTHAIATAGALASVWLLRRCLDELGVTGRLERWTATAALVVATALAPRTVTTFSMYAVGNHAEGAAIDVILVALFVWRIASPSRLRAALQWALVGLALYVNKGTVLVVLTLAPVELWLARRSPGRLALVGAGFAVGLLPEILVVAQRHAMGWATITEKASRNSGGFPRTFLSAIGMLGEHRVELLAAWTFAVGVSVVSARRTRSVALSTVVLFLSFHLATLAVMAQGGVDKYTLYAYPMLLVAYAVLVAASMRWAATRWGRRGDAVAAIAAIALTAVLYRPDAVTWGTATVSALWREQAGAVCSWRFAEGFGREYRHGLATSGGTREEHVIQRCRSLTDDQSVDCIGGIARELHWRSGGKVDGEPPASLDDREKRAYAFEYGTHRRGDVRPCHDFTSETLQATCAGAVQLDCLVFADVYARFDSGRGLGRPQCTIEEPPMGGYWGSMRRELLGRSLGPGPNLRLKGGDDAEIAGCEAILQQCY